MMFLNVNKKITFYFMTLHSHEKRTPYSYDLTLCFVAKRVLVMWDCGVFGAREKVRVQKIVMCPSVVVNVFL